MKSITKFLSLCIILMGIACTPEERIETTNLESSQKTKEKVNDFSNNPTYATEGEEESTPAEKKDPDDSN